MAESISCSETEIEVKSSESKKNESGGIFLSFNSQEKAQSTRAERGKRETITQELNQNLINENDEGIAF